jgi:hypothetical protein
MAYHHPALPNDNARQRLITRFSILCLVLQLFVLPNVSQAESAGDEQAANAAALAWLKMVDDGKSAESWQALAAPTRESISQWRWKLGFALAQRKFGPCSARKLRSSRSTNKSPGGRSGEFVLLEYDTMSAKQGSVVEKLTVSHESDGQWRVGGYVASK